MIVTLAGHVDHGKTSLVKALTGIDTDRLAEEKRRGLTIDLGFAYTDLDDLRIGFVDVPGHHRFVHNMVAGVAAQQFGLVVVAADDGVMPQTLEHLQILKLIGVERAAFALTKTDRCEANRIAEVREELQQLSGEFQLPDSPIIETSVIDGTGIDALRETLAAAARATAPDHDTTCFRLAIDRAFLIRGSGLVVTGTVHSGTVEIGQDLCHAPSGAPVRVRSLHVQDREANEAHPGDRCAINVTGIDRTTVERGDWLVAPETLATCRSAVIDLTVLGDFPRTVKHWLPVHAYLATSHSAAHIALLDSPPLAANDSALVELEFSNVVHPKHGDRIVLRDHARERTIGGGPVVEIGASRGNRRRPERLRTLVAQRLDDPGAALDALLEETRAGVDLVAFRQLRNLPTDHMEALLNDREIVRFERGGRVLAYPAAAWGTFQDNVVERLDAYHKAAPHSPGLNQTELTRVVDVPAALLTPLLEALQSAGQIRQSGGHYQSSGFSARLPEAEEKQLRQFEALLAEGDQPPSLGDMAKRIGGDLRTLQAAAKRFAKTGRIVVVSDTRIFLPDQITGYAKTAETLQSQDPAGFSVRQFRDATGIGRNLAIEVLEFFDAHGYTRRYDDRRRIVSDQSALKIA